MSEPVKNTEVEDVLSSIRRLVSEEKRPLQPARPERPPDRLVLTPALRVEERVDATERVPATADDTSRFDMRADGEKEQEQIDAVPDASSDETAARALEEDYADDPYGFDSEEDGLDDDETPVVSRDSHTAEDAAVAELQEPTDAEIGSLSAKIEALETAIGSIADDWDPDGANADDNAGTKAQSMAWEDVDVDADDIDAVAKGSDPSAGDAQPVEIEAVPEPEVAFSHHAATVDVEEDEVTGTDFEMDAGPEAEIETSEELDDAPGIDLAADDQLLDEDTLRELISEIVHAELQGALGERITRNVRRLVRREIHRALTARDLD